jgi:hypothetical protein
VIDGMKTSTIEHRIARADTVVFLDLLAPGSDVRELLPRRRGLGGSDSRTGG